MFYFVDLLIQMKFGTTNAVSTLIDFTKQIFIQMLTTVFLLNKIWRNYMLSLILKSLFLFCFQESVVSSDLKASTNTWKARPLPSQFLRRILKTKFSSNFVKTFIFIFLIHGNQLLGSLNCSCKKINELFYLAKIQCNR